MLKVVHDDQQSHDGEAAWSLLDEIVRDGAGDARGDSAALQRTESLSLRVLIHRTQLGQLST